MDNDGKTADELAEEAAAQTAENEKKENEAADAEARKVEEAKAKPADDKLNSVLEKITDALKPNVTPEQREAQIVELEKTSGFSRQQLVFMGKEVSKTAVTANLSVHQELGQMKAEKILGGFAESLIDKVKEEMHKLDASVQADPRAWENMAYLVKGKHGDSVKPKTNQTKVEGGDVKGLTNPGKGTPAGSGSSKKQYTADEQTIISRYFGGKAEDYETTKSRKGLSVRTPDDGSKGNAADKELARITGGIYS